MLATTKEEIKEIVCTKGARIQVKWTEEEIGDSGWSPQWYVAIVQSYNNLLYRLPILQSLVVHK